ncbi:MAG: CoB--CoM heterodisulfide reductase iron-sulfur subunit A family protein [Planctomycetota bacterium]
MSAPQETRTTDTLVIGGGIAGLQTALDLAEQGFEVTVVEKGPSVGGKMISLSKVFPTLDCASCITTPKMAAAAHHENITILTLAEVESVERRDDGFSVRVELAPRYVDEEKCIGCRLCEYACDSNVPDEFEDGLGGRRAIRVPFTNAIPQIALLDPTECNLCGKCVKACPTDAVILDQTARSIEIEAGAVVVATGYELTPIEAKREYRGEELDNVISPLTMERLLAPHGPYGRVLRPSDGKIPDSIAFVQCAGSRDASLGVPYCSRVCCMYAIKQAMLLAGAVPLADITIYYMDIRAFGKGYETFYRNAAAMGVEFVKGKVARISDAENGDVTVRFEHVDGLGQVEEKKHDLVVLSLGMVPAADLSDRLPIEVGSDGFVRVPKPLLEPGATDEPGIFVTGTAAGPKDIVDAIAEAGSAAMAVTNHLRRREPAACAVQAEN